MPEFVKPQVGDGATLSYPQDSYPFVVVRVSESGKTVYVKPVEAVSKATGHSAARFDGPFPVWSHKYTPEELQALGRFDAPEVAVRYGKYGWSRNFSVGEAYYHRNYSY